MFFRKCKGHKEKESDEKKKEPKYSWGYEIYCCNSYFTTTFATHSVAVHLVHQQHKMSNFSKILAHSSPCDSQIDEKLELQDL